MFARILENHLEQLDRAQTHEEIKKAERNLMTYVVAMMTLKISIAVVFYTFAAIGFLHTINLI